MSRKDVSFDQLLAYLNRKEEKERISIVHNFRSQNDDLKGIEDEFTFNHQFSPRRSNGNVLFHEVMSFSGENRDVITEDMLEDVARQYIKKRAYNALVYAKIHLDRSNPHIHFIISGNLLESSRKLRLSKARFHTIKRELEHYQLAKYPFLDKSIATREERTKRGLGVNGKRKSRNAKEQARRQKRENTIRTKFQECINALTHDEYLVQLKQAGLREYWHGKNPGIVDLTTGKKHRLKTLGLLEDYRESIERWKMQQERIHELMDDRINKTKKRTQNLNFRELISIELIREKRITRGR